MTKQIMTACLVSCIAMAVSACNDGEDFHLPKCDGNASACLSDTQLKACAGGQEIVINCNANQKCQVVNGVAACVSPVFNLCGNNVLDAGEQCDGSDLGGKTCGSFIPNGIGTLSCNSACQLDTSNCSLPVAYCGNGKIEGNEQCDGANINGKTCSDLLSGYTGNLQCDSSCRFVTTNCQAAAAPEPICGNAQVENGEQCDGGNLNGKTCAEIVPGTVGTLSCNNACLFVTDNCQVPTNSACGNGMIEAGEQCDGSQLNNKTCGDLVAGTVGILTCTDKCTFNTNYCYAEDKPVDAKCGDNKIDSGEQCDGTNLNNKTCADLGNLEGSLSCDNDCHFVTDNCKPIEEQTKCGDGVISAGEQCDGSNLNGQTCESVIPGTSGTLSCDSECHFITSSCKLVIDEPVCGNNIVEAGEQCDRSDLNNVSCNDIVAGTVGTLVCTSDCKFDASLCVTPIVEPYCGDGVISGSEQCDGSNLNGKSCKDFVTDSKGSLSCNDKCQFVTTGCLQDNAPVVGSSCEVGYSECYEGDVYYCYEGKVVRYQCESLYQDVACMFYPKTNEYECLDTKMVDSNNVDLCESDGDAILYEEPYGCQYYESEGVIYYEECTLIDGKFYGYSTVAESICFTNESETSVVLCDSNSSYVIEECNDGCTFTPETVKYYAYAQCDGSVEPPITDPVEGSACTEDYTFACTNNTVLVCFGGVWTAYRECSGEERCDTISVNGRTISADCTIECKEEEVGYIVGYGSQCNTDQYGDYFELFGCMKSDSGDNRVFGNEFATSLCYNASIELICSEGEVILAGCAECTDDYNSTSSAYEATCH